MDALRQKYWEPKGGKDDQMREIEEADRVPFIKYLRNYAKEQAEQRNYKDAKRAREMVVALQENEPGLKTRGLNDEQIKEHEEKLSEMEKKFQKRYDKRNARFNEKIQRLDEKHASELDEFERYWAEKVPVRYRKVSTRVLNFKKIESSLTTIEEYEEAEQVQQIVENLSEGELTQKQQALLKDYREAKFALLTKQANQRDIIEDERQKELDLAFVKNERKRRIYELRLRIITDEAENDSKKLQTRQVDNIYVSHPNSENVVDHAKGLKPVLLDLKPPNGDDNQQANDKYQKDSKKRSEFYKITNKPLPLAPQANPTYAEPSKTKGKKEDD